MTRRFNLAISEDIDRVTAETAALKTRVDDLERPGTEARLAALEAANVALRARVTTLESAAVRP